LNYKHHLSIAKGPAVPTIQKLAIQGIQEFLDYPSIERDKGEGEEAAKNFFY
jgi:hypothetical protein